MADDLQNRRLTRFPGHDEVGSRETNERHVGGNDKVRRMTRFPGSIYTMRPLLSRASLEPRTGEIGTVAMSTPPRLPLRVKPSTSNISKPSASTPKFTRKTGHKPQDSGLIRPISINHRNPWDIYKLIRAIDRKGRTKAAYTKSTPPRLVTIKDIDFSGVKSTFQHRNLVEVIGLHQYEGRSYLVAEYAQVSLKHVIAIPLSLEEVHVATICSQVYHCSLFVD